MKHRKLLVVLALAAGVAGLGVFTVGRTLRQPSAIAEMRGDLAALRAAADSCGDALEVSQAELLLYNTRLDSMRGRVRGMESLQSRGTRGVAADSYDIYLELFNRYNDSAQAWESRVAALRAERDQCQLVIDQHNAAVDSLRRLLREAQR